MGHAEVTGDRGLEGGDRRPEDELLAAQHGEDPRLDLGRDLAVLGGEIDVGDRRDRRIGRPGRDGVAHGATRSRSTAGSVRRRIVASSESDQRSM